MIKGSIEVYVSFLNIILRALLFSNIIIEQGGGRFVSMIVWRDNTTADSRLGSDL